MLYSEIIANRTAAPCAQKIIAFRYYNKPEMVYKPQFPLAHDVLELYNGKLEQEYQLKLVGRHEGGHLFRAGFKQKTFDFSGFVSLDENCDSSLAVAAAETEIKCFYEFLRGYVETNDYDDIPDPRLSIGFLVPTDEGLEFPFETTDPPFNGSPTYPFAGATDPGTWLDGIFKLVAGSFKIEKRYYSETMLNFNFQLEQLPISTIIT